MGKIVPIPKVTKLRGAKRAAPARYPPAFPIVGVGASAGGLEAFTQLLENLPGDTGMAFVLVQHLDPLHPSALPQLLSRSTSLPLHEVTNGLRVEPNHVYVIPPNTSLEIAEGILKLRPREDRGGGYRSIDSFFASLAKDQGEHAIGIILSGAASDGTLGLEAIKAQGGITFAQDNSAKSTSMPRSAIAAGCVDLVLSPKNIAQELTRIAHHPYLKAQRATSATETQAAPKRHAREHLARNDSRREKSGGNGLQKILLLLRGHSGVDFSLYKMGTIGRRIDRRMVLNKVTSLDAYAQFLRKTPGEVEALHTDLLIPVTSFFRDPESFEALKRVVFPKLLVERDNPVRIWVPGCSTGQEAYSLAMAFAEFADNLTQPPRLQIFASDVNDEVLERARSGLYVKALLEDLSPERRRRFFVEEDGGYRISKSIRENVVFARQNLLSDPPFSRMNLISCRNVMIYLESNSQKSILPKFHYALRPKGFLFLGASESIGAFTALFEQVDKKHKFFHKKLGPTPALRTDYVARHIGDKARSLIPVAAPGSQGAYSERDAEQEADRVTLSRHAPPSVLINADFQVRQFRGDTSPYLKPPTGRATFDTLKMAMPELVLPLRAALNKAKKTSKTVRSENLKFGRTRRSRSVSVEVVPLKGLKERCYLIFFEETDNPSRLASASSSPRSMKPRVGTSNGRRGGESATHEIARLKADLAETREYLRSIQEQAEASNEELQASNEEVISANEELQSINEELETSQEELESTNEELTTLNEEMSNRNAELNIINSDLVNFQRSAQVPVVLLGRDLAVRRFSAEAEKVLNLSVSDVGLPLTYLKHNLAFPDLDKFIGEVITSVQEREREVQDGAGRWYSLRVRPYLSVENKVDGAVLVLTDIDVLKQVARTITEAREQAEAIIRTVPDPLIILDADLRIQAANDAFYLTFKTTPAETTGKLIFDIGHGSWRIPKLRETLADVIPLKTVVNDFEIIHDFEKLGRRVLLLNARVLNELAGTPSRVLVGIRDITQVLAYQSDIRRSELRYRRLFEAARDGVLILDPETRRISDSNPFMSELLGYTPEELRGKELFEIGLLSDQQANIAAFEQLRKERHIRYEDLPLKTKGGEHRDVEFVSNLYTEDGREAIQCNIRDITARKRAEEHRDLLMHELDHRVKNILTVVQSIARQTSSNSTSQEHFIDVFEARLLALAKTNDLLIESEWNGAPLREIILMEVSPYDAGGPPRVTLVGDEVDLDSLQASALGLAFHELATNAAKYGALSVPNGRVAIAWDVGGGDGSRVLRLRWTESGGPAVKIPDRKGFGSELIAQSVVNELKAAVQLEFLPEGVHFTLELPLDRAKKGKD